MRIFQVLAKIKRGIRLAAWGSILMNNVTVSLQCAVMDALKRKNPQCDECCYYGCFFTTPWTALSSSGRRQRCNMLQRIHILSPMMGISFCAGFLFLSSEGVIQTQSTCLFFAYEKHKKQYTNSSTEDMNCLTSWKQQHGVKNSCVWI